VFFRIAVQTCCDSEIFKKALFHSTVMIQYVLWAVSFVSLWITLVWLNVVFLEPKPDAVLPRRLPRIAIAIPCFNKEPFLEKTIASLASLNYPQRLLRCIIVDDCSTDNTFCRARQLQEKYPGLNIEVCRHRKNQGKAAAMNTALASVDEEYFSCLDADTRVHPDALLRLLPHFGNNAVAAVIGQVKVDAPKNLFERLQRIEYIISNFIRYMMSHLGTLCLTPGVLPLYRTRVLKEVGGFAEGGLTEDLEIAMRLRSRGYDIRMEPRSVTHTTVPRKWWALWRQRIRWYRGFCFNHFAYRRMLFSRKHGLYGMFQMPLNIAAVFLLLVSVVLVGYHGLHNLYETLYRSLTIKGYIVNHLFEFPTLKDIFLGHNVQVLLPVFVAAGLGFYLFYRAHLKFSEQLLRHLPTMFLYIPLMPYLTVIHWLSALVQEMFGVNRKW
jgi:cellulose synthase/poly-beta-1,6-N-acetylglucosamine synthase-like glycosyltransferase